MKQLSPRAAAATAGSVATLAALGGLTAAIVGPAVTAQASVTDSAPHCLTPTAFNKLVDAWPDVRNARANHARISSALRAARATEKAALSALNSRPITPTQLRLRTARYMTARHARAALVLQQRAAAKKLVAVRASTVAELNDWLGESRCQSTTSPAIVSSSTTTPATSNSSSTTTPATSSSSSSTSPAPVGGSTLPAPTGLAAGATTPLLTGTLKLSWNAVIGATNYNVYRNGTLLSTVSATTFNPTGTTNNSLATYTVTASATGHTTSTAATLSAGVYQGTSVADQRGRTVYGNIQTSVVVTSTASKAITGCWATYPTNSDSGTINPPAITNLCNQVVTKHPVASTVAALITNVSGASATSPAFKTSLQAALTTAGMP